MSFPQCRLEFGPPNSNLKSIAAPQNCCPLMGRRRWPPLGGVQWNWSQVRDFGPKKFRCSSLGDILQTMSLKNTILDGSRLDFGGLLARFWRVWASIWKVLGLDFGASRPRFSSLQTNMLRKNYFSASVLPEASSLSFSSFPNCMAVLQYSCYQRGKQRWSPLRGFNPPPTEGVQGVLDHKPIVLS